MKKTLLFGCAAAVALTSVVATAEPETTDSIKKAFTEFLAAQTQFDQLFDLNQVTVEADGANFNVTLPAVDSGTVKMPSRTIRLTEAGQFNNQPQYKVDSVIETVQAMFKDLMPGATFTTQSADLNMIWVPKYNLVVNNSQNIKGIVINVPDTFRMTVDSLVSDTLVRAVSENKMDRADSQDGKGVVVSANTLQLTIPSVSYSDQILNCDMTSDPFVQGLSSAQATYTLEIPTILVGMTGSTEPAGSFAVNSKFLLRDNIWHTEIAVDNVVLGGALKMIVPPVLTPTEIHINMDMEGMETESFRKALLLMQTGDEENAEEIQKASQKAMANAVIKINSIEAKNAEAGIALSGTIRNQKGEDGEDSPVIEAKVVLTNLDKISPVPVVNEAQCKQTKEQMAEVSDKEMAEQAIAYACAPHGGILDDIRPYLNPEDRVVNADGTTTDTLTISTKDGTVIVNGKEFQ